MILQNALLGGLLLAGHAAAKFNHVNALFRRSEDFEDILRKDATLLTTLSRRQDGNSVDPPPSMAASPRPGNLTESQRAEWKAATEPACAQAIRALNGTAPNPSGLTVCYNIPVFLNSSGTFEAELRMYNVSAPTAEWAGVTAVEVMMELNYTHAAVFATNETKPPVRNDGEPQEVKIFSYIGKLNDDLQGRPLLNGALLFPNIRLMATNPSGIQVVTMLSSNATSFVNGAFAGQGNLDSAQAAAALAVATKFHLPGTNLAFFPVGLVVTCVWTAFFLLTVGFGTVGRIQFREQYRRRVKRELANGVRTI